MAKFTATVPLSIRFFGNEISGAAGVVHRIPDALYEEFVAQVVPSIPGGVTWAPIDEIANIGTPAHSSLTGVTSGQHHAQAHSITGADHTGTLPHSSLSSITATDHHAAATAGPDANDTVDAAGAAGTASTFARSQHGHRVNTDAGTAADIGATATAGTSGTISRAGHVHRIMGSGTFPGSPATNTMWFRTDLGMWFYYDGTRWLSDELFYSNVPNSALNMGVSGIAATTTAANRINVPPPSGGSDIYIVDHIIDFLVNGGTALGASHKWVGIFNKVNTSNAETGLVTDTIDSGSSSVWRQTVDAVNALLGTTSFVLQSSWTKTGTPGNLLVYESFTYRVVAT